MPNSPRKNPDTKQIKKPATSTSPPSIPIQHGLLFNIPSESIIHICCYLDPYALYTLSITCKRLHLLISNDNIWRRAFAFQLLGIRPEESLEGATAVLLRRSAPTWKKELINHDAMARRWTKSTNSTVTHHPHRHHSLVDDLHMMPSQAVLSSCLAHGLVGRSHLLRGSVVRGYFSPNASLHNPSRVTSSAITSDGNFAQIAWGLEQGEICATIAPKAVEPGALTSAKTVLGPVRNWHEGMVTDIVWDSKKFVSIGVDGQAKMWSTNRTLDCLWTSNKMQHSLVKVASMLAKGVIAAAMRNGDIVIWNGVGLENEEITTTVIPSPSKETEPSVRSIHVKAFKNSATILIAFIDDPFFHIFQGQHPATTFAHSAFGQPSSGPITSLQPFFATSQNEISFVLVGDALGYINVYTFTDPNPVRRFEAFETGDIVTALAWNGTILIGGSASGQTKIFDGYTFGLLRTFNPPPQRSLRGSWPVSEIKISVEKDTMAIRCGDSIMGWHAGPVPRRGKGGVRGRHVVGTPSTKKGKTANAKYHEKIELKQSIHESKAALQADRKRVEVQAARRVAQDSTLDKLGLSEAEAIEYLLMVSREEEEARLREQEALIFSADDDVAGPSLTKSLASSVRRSSPSPPPRTPNKDTADAFDEFPTISPSKASIPSPASSVWSTPLKPRVKTSSGKSTHGSPSTSSVALRSKGKGRRKSPSPPARGSYSSSASIGRSPSDSEDEELRLALQLSLQEM